MNKIRTGKYKHYKGKLYEVVGNAFHSETGEEMVLYKMLYSSDNHPQGTLWVRPYKMFFEKVQVEGNVVERFEFIESV